MHTENAIFMRADAGTVFTLARAVEDWPRLLPHYRWVKILDDEGPWRIVEMSAWRDRIPVRWAAEQRCFPDEARIAFHHVGGVTTGMDVVWEFSPREDGVDVRIVHDLALGWPLIGGFVAQRIIGPMFVSYIADQTLWRIKEIAEAQSRTPLEGARR
jgi:ribosome-associated toxin RatA of RatAB toxin-antitoxin module